MSLSRRTTRAILSCVVTIATALAAYWAIRVPFFQEPDELAHSDYVFELYNVGRPFFVPGAIAQLVVTPQERYLVQSVRYRQSRYGSSVDLPAGYGEPAFFARLDREAPHVGRGAVPAPGSAVPSVTFNYPIGFYALAATFMRLADWLHPNSITASLFAARAIGSICLPIMLVLAFGAFRRSGFARATALAATAAIGFLPLTSWVFGYVQPDVLTTTLVTAVVFVIASWKRDPTAMVWPAALASTLISLAFVKQHYAAAAWLSALLAAASIRGVPRARSVMALVFVPAALAIYAALRMTPVGTIGAPRLPHRAASSIDVSHRLADGVGYFVNAFRDVYGEGSAFADFWWSFGFHGASVFTGRWAYVVEDILLAATLIVLAFFIVRQRYVLGRLLLVARLRSPAVALRLLAGDISINLYLAVTTILFGVYVASAGTVWLEGRYWLPVIVPLIVIVGNRIPRFVPARIRRTAGLALVCAWAAYATIAAPLGVFALERSFYGIAPPPAHEPYAGIIAEVPDRIRHGGTVRIEGYAVDGQRGLPATDVFVTIDGIHRIRAKTGLASLALKDAYNDDELAHGGFQAFVDTKSLEPGTHTLGVLVIERRAPSGLTAPGSEQLTVER